MTYSKTMARAVASWMAALPVMGCGSPKIAPFGELDHDGNGRISAAEARGDAALERVFAEVDADGNGQLSAGEYLEAVHRI